VAPSPHGEIGLRDAVAAALLGNPGLAVFSWNIRAGEARALQAAALPNPELLVEVENIGGSGQRSGVEQTETTFWLAQLVELGGKRAKRRAVAALAGEQAVWDYEAARLQALAATTRAFIVALAAQARVALAEEAVALARRSVAAAARRVEVGAAPPVDIARAELQLHSGQVEASELTSERAASFAALAATWGESTPRFTALRGDLFASVDPPPPLARLEAALRDHPAIARWRSEVAAREAELELARARRLPDPTVALGARHFSSGDDAALVFSFGVPLPVFDRRQGNILAAQYEVAAARAGAVAAQATARTALTARLAELTAAHGTITALRERVLPGAERVFAGVRDGYAKGLFRALEVVDAQRTLFELRAAELDAALSYQLARVEIDALTATLVDPAAAERREP
jgi:cobalt-zinc-cadmium efflux system outer membrane protein